MAVGVEGVEYEVEADDVEADSESTVAEVGVVVVGVVVVVEVDDVVAGVAVVVAGVVEVDDVVAGVAVVVAGVDELVELEDDAEPVKTVDDEPEPEAVLTVNCDLPSVHEPAVRDTVSVITSPEVDVSTTLMEDRSLGDEASM